MCIPFTCDVITGELELLLAITVIPTVVSLFLCVHYFTVYFSSLVFFVYSHFLSDYHVDKQHLNSLVLISISL